VRILGKIDALDGFRGCSVLLVVVHHLPLAVPWLFHRVTKGGGFGVDASFVLSGFLSAESPTGCTSGTSRSSTRYCVTADIGHRSLERPSRSASPPS